MALQHSHNPYPGYLPQPTTSQQRRHLSQAGDAVGNFLTNYWALIITVALGLVVLTAISIPFLSYFGLDALAKPLFFALHYVCAQIPSHSFYIFGHQLGLCARNFSIYTSMFLTSLVFVLTKKRLTGIPWWIWLLLILPMAIDGTTQMFGLRESTDLLRVITGTLFGVGNIWFALPLMQKSLLSTMAYPPQYAYPYGPIQQANQGAHFYQPMAHSVQQQTLNQPGINYYQQTVQAAPVQTSDTPDTNAIQPLVQADAQIEPAAQQDGELPLG